MTYHEVETLQFLSKGESIGVVRAGANEVVLAISSRSNGDAEVILSTDEARRLIEVLSRAILRASDVQP
jgi:hypothetical protein